jgi:galactose mutarotase-like enzyme
MQAKTTEIVKGKNKLVINQLGARVEELILGGQKIFTKVVRGDGKEASSHPCIPQFGPDNSGIYNLPQHGSARNKDFKQFVSDGKITLSLSIRDGNYPEGLNIKQEHSLTNEEYILRTIVSNFGFQSLPVNFAEHFYWDAPDGWEGLKINGINVTEVVKKDASIEIKPENIILIPGQKAIILNQKGFSIFRLWAYGNPQTDEYDNNYVCIEPVESDPEGNFFGSEKSIIKSDQSKVTEIKIQLNEH